MDSSDIIMNFEELIKTARENVVHMDKIERKNNFATPQELTLQIHADTIKIAIEAGLKIILNDRLEEGLITIAEASVMLEDLIKRLKRF